jgi:hypothetical protein
VGIGVAGYTGIIERGIEQQRGAKPMTTKQNDTNLMTVDQLDTVSGGLQSNRTNLQTNRANGVAILGQANGLSQGALHAGITALLGIGDAVERG